MRVALLNPVFWPEVRRGSERFAHDLARSLAPLGIDATIVCGAPRPGIGEEDGVRVVRVRRLPEWRRARRLKLEHTGHLPFLRRHLRSERYDVLHPLYPTDASAALEAGPPVVLSLMGLPDRASLVARRGRAEAIRDVARRAAATVVLSHAALAAFERQLGIQARVIPGGVDLDAFAPGPGRSPAPAILCVAPGTEPRKHVGVVLDAFALVRERVPGARLLLSRRGNEAAAGPGVELVDADDRAALADRYREAHATVLLSEHEAFGLTLLESLACGTPVVGARSGAIAEVVGEDGSAGRLAEPRDAGSAADALLAVLAAPPDPAACRARAEGFSLTRTASSYAALYRELGGE